MNAALAQPYPAKPVRILVPWTPGGVTDVLTRTVAQAMSESTGQQFVVENRPGAGGTLGMNLLAKSPADGYTIAASDLPSHAISATLYSKLPYAIAPMAYVMLATWTGISRTLSIGALLVIAFAIVQGGHKLPLVVLVSTVILSIGLFRTRLVVAHRASTAARADMVVWLDRGRVRGVDTHRRLWQDPEYRALFGPGEAAPEKVEPLLLAGSES